MSNGTNAEKVVRNLSKLISQDLAGYANEYWTPHFTADQMDEELLFRATRARELIRIRGEFEQVMFGLKKEGLS